MRQVFGNATILAGEELECLRGYVVVEDGRIAEVGEGSPGRSYVNLKRGVVCPSFTNAHTHIGDACAPDAGAYLHLRERVGSKGLKFRLLEDRERVRQGMRRALEEMRRTGTGCFADFREGGIEGLELLRQVVEQSSVSCVALGRPDGDPPERVIERADGFGVSSVSNYTREELRRMRRLAERLGKLFAVHCSELRDDTAEVLKLEPDFVVHMTSASPESLEEVCRRRLPVVLCPRANGSFAAGLPEAGRLLECTTVALGTDNVMANSLNMMREMEFVFKLARGQSRDEKLRAELVLRAATINGRKILGRDSNAIQEGNVADFVIFRNKYIYEPALSIVHRMEAEDIRGFVIGNRYVRRV